MMISEQYKTGVGLRTGLFVLCILLSSFIDAATVEVSKSEPGILHAEQWELSRHGESILASNSIAETVKSWMTNQNQRIELQYPGGEEGEFWVHELMDWLVALGVPSDRLVAVPGSGQEDIIRIRTIMTGE